MVDWNCSLLGEYLWHIVGHVIGCVDCKYCIGSADIPGCSFQIVLLGMIYGMDDTYLV